VAALLPVLLGAQGNQEPLKYHGWALGISLDSARKLTLTQIGKPLECAGVDTDTMFCHTPPGAEYASLYFSPVPRRLEEMSILLPFDRRASRDSLEKWLTSRWGTPIPREVLETSPKSKSRSEPETETIGSWAREGTVFGMVAIASGGGTRTLSVSIYSPAREIRMMQQHADSAKTRK
jgi:hypothetical protein